MKVEPIAMHGGDRVAAALAAQGVRFVFTLCGGHISPILTASRARGIRIVDVRDEATAVFAADAAARLTGVPDLGPAVDEAFAVARAGVPGPVCIECPVDLLYDEASIRQWYADAAGKGSSIPDRLLRFYLNRHVEKMFAGSAAAAAPQVRAILSPAATESSVAAAAAALARAERPLIVIGSQALALAAEAPRIAAAVAELGIPVYLSGMARGLLGRDHVLQMRHQRRAALRESDCVLLAGVPCDFRLDYGRHVRRSATLIAANRSAKEARMNRRPDIAAIGDAGVFLERLAAPLAQAGRRWSSWIEDLRTRDLKREAEIDEQAGRAGEWVNPIAFLRALDQAAGENAVMVADGGDFVATASYIAHPRAPLSWLDPGVFGPLGVGAGFALGAALCRPDESEV